MFPTDDEVEDLLSHMDEDKSGMVELSELIKQMAHQINIRKEWVNGEIFSFNQMRTKVQMY